MLPHRRTRPAGKPARPYALPESGVRVIGLRRCSRGALLGGTALRAAALVVLATPATAQLAPNAHPLGGNVVVGAASIAQKGNTTDITQTTGRAAIDWQSFNIGKSASVVFSQPNAKSIVLNTVVGPNPSEIAGRITANGVVAVVNQSGVIFDQGSQVDTAGLIVSAAGITRQNFAAGHMVFDQAPHPGASVVNNGNITIRQAGLAALVAPQVVNNGLISAKLGRVVLGGATTYTLDLYGDGLLTLNVTGQVTQVSLGNRTIPALVTNAGTILADGGSVVLNASAVDGLVRTLVEAGGTVSASSVGSQAGRVLVQGTGGSVDIAGAVSATGVAVGTTGGTIVADATGMVSVASSARIDASGDAGGGLIAIGTTAARARSPRAASTLTAQSASVAAGARLSADALGHGDGGQVTILSTGSSSLGGAISVLGGTMGGNGGAVELSGETVGLTGRVDSRAPQGRTGSLLIDPVAIVVSQVAPTGLAGTISYFKDSVLSAQTTGITLTTTAGMTTTPGDIDFLYSPGAATNTVANNGSGSPKPSFVVNAGNGSINIDAGVTLTSTGALSLTASGGIDFDQTLGKTMFGFTSASASSSVLSGPIVTMTAGTGIDLAGATITGTTSLALSTTAGDITGGSITSTTISGTATSGSVILDGANHLGTISGLTAGSNISLLDGATLDVTGTIQAGSALAIAAPTLDVAASGSLTAANMALSANKYAIDGAVTATGAVALGLRAAGALTLGGLINNNFDATGVSKITAATLALGAAAGPNGPVLDTNTTSLNILQSFGTSSMVIDLYTTGKLTESLGTGIMAAAVAGAATSYALDGTVHATGAVALGLSASGTLTLGGLGANNFDLLGVSNITAGTLALGATLGASGLVADSNTVSLIISQSFGSVGTVIGLYSSGGITEGAGVAITASTLIGAAAGDVAVASNSNAVGTLGSFTTTGGSLQFTDGQSLITGGDVSAGTGLTITVHAPGSTLNIGDDLTGTSVTLSAPGAITQTAGTIAATSGNVSLTSANAGIAFGGTLQASAGLVSLITSTGIADTSGAATGVVKATSLFGTAATGDITIDGTSNSFGSVTRATATTGNVNLTTGQTMVVAGPIIGGTVSLISSGGDITEVDTGDHADEVLTNVLSGSAHGSISLTNGTQTIAFITDLTASGGSLTLVDAHSLSITGTVSSVGLASITVTGAGNPLTIGGAVVANASVAVPAPTLFLQADTLTVQGGASLTALGGTISLASDAPTLAPMSVVDAGAGLIGFSRATSGALTFASSSTATLTAGTLALGSLNGVTSSGSVTDLHLTGALHFNGTLDVFASGSLTAVTGLNVGTLSGAVNSASLAGTDTIGTLKNFTVTTGGLSLVDSAGLAIAGSVDAGGAASFTVKSGSLTELATAGLTATSLTGTAAGSIDLTGSANDFSSLGNLGSGSSGTLALADAHALTVSGSLSSGGAMSLAVTGASNSLSLGAGSVLAPGTTGGLSLTAAGDIVQNASGTITMGPTTSLTGSAGGMLDLAGRNSVLMIGALQSGGALTFNAEGALTVAGNVIGSSVDLQSAGLLRENAGETITATGTAPGTSLTLDATGAAGSITVSGLLQATSGTVVLDAAAAVLETPASGGIDASSIGGTAMGIALLGTNTLGGIGALNAGSGSLALANTGTLDLTGALHGAAGVTLSATGDISQSSGSITTGGSLTVSSSAGSVSLISLTNKVGTLGASSAAGDFAYTDSGTLVVAAKVKVGNGHDLTITAPTLDLSAGSLSAIGGTITIASDALTLGGPITTGAGTGLVDIGTDLSTTQTVSASTSFSGITTGTLGLGSTTHVTELDITSALDLSGLPNLALFTTPTGTVTSSTGITASMLTGNAGTVTLHGANKITTLGSFTSARFDLVDGVSLLTVAGPVTGSITSLSAGNLDLTGSITGTNQLTLIATSGTISETGSLNTALLTGRAFGGVSLTGTNDITGLGSFSATGFILTDGNLAAGGTLSVTGTLNAALNGAGDADLSTAGATRLAISSGGSIAASDASLSASTLSIAGGITVPGTITLSAGTIDESTGALSAAVVTGSATGTADLSGTNAFSTLTGFSANGLTVMDGSGLTLAGTIDGTGTASITGASLDIASGALVRAATSLSLTTAGRITEEGSITAGSLTGTSGTFATALTGTNTIPLLGDFASNGFTFAETGALTVDGTVRGATSAKFSGMNTLSIASSGAVLSDATSLSAGTIGVTGSLTGSNTLTLTASKVAATGAVTAGTLTGVITNGATLSSVSNSITDLGPFSATDFSLTQGPSLTIVGSVTGTNSLGITLTAGALSESLAAGVTATLLTASAVGSLALQSATNDVGTLGAMSVTGATGTLRFSEPGSLTLAGAATAADIGILAGGALDVTGSADGSIVALTGSSLAIGGSVTGTSSVVLVAISGGITEAGGTIVATAGTLTGSAETDADLSGSNTIAALGDFSAANLTLVDAGTTTTTLSVTGSVVIGNALSLTAPAIAIASLLDVDTADLIATTGTIAETGAGAIDAATLTGSSVGTTKLDGANLISSLSTFGAAGFSLNDGQALDVAGPVTGGPSVSIASTDALTVSGNVSGTAIGLSGLSLGLSSGGSLAAGAAGQVTLTALGDATPSDGSIAEAADAGITAGTLTGSATGNVGLTGLNTITSLGNFTAGPFTLADTSTLAIAGTLSAIGASVDLSAAQLTETGDILAGSLTGATSGSTSLTSTGNAISTLGSFTASSFTLVDGVTLLFVDGPVQGGSLVSISNLGTQLATGNLDISGSIISTAITLHADQQLTIDGTLTPGATVAGSTLDLTAGTAADTGSLGETGQITVQTLTGNVQGEADLSGNGSNAIGTLGAFTATGGLTLVDSADLKIVGPVVSGPFLNITTGGPLTLGDITGSIVALGATDITIDGPIVASKSLTLSALGTTTGVTTTPGTISETGTGGITTPVFQASAAGGDITLLGSNSIATLSTVTAADFSLLDAATPTLTLLVAGAQTITGNLSLSAPSIDIAATAAANVATLTATGTAAAAGTIVESGAGLIDAGTLTGSAVGTAVFGGANLVDSLGDFTANGLRFVDDQNFSVSGIVKGGPSAVISGGSAGNQFSMVVFGSVTATDVGLSAGVLALDGSIAAPGTLTLTAAGTIPAAHADIAESAGAHITAGTLTGSAQGSASLIGTNTITDLASFSAAPLTLDNTGMLTIIGPVAGAYTPTGGSLVTGPVTLTVSGGPLIVASNGSVSGSVVSLAASGSLSVAGSVAGGPTAVGLTAGTSLAIGGSVTGGAVKLVATTGSITETGTLGAAALTGGAATSASLTGTNSIATLGSFTADTLTLTDLSNLTVAGPVTGTTSIAISDTGTHALTQGTISVTGVVHAPAVTLTAAGNIGETATGVVNAGNLSGSAGGSASFTSSANTIATVGAFTAHQGFALDDGRGLAVTGLVAGGPSVTIDDTGGSITVSASITGSTTGLTASTDITIPGSITATDLGLIALNGSIGETGTLSVSGTLTGSADGAASFAGAVGANNKIAALGDFSAFEGFALTDGEDLAVTGTVHGGTLVAMTDLGHALTVAATGTIVGDTTSLSAGDIVIPGTIDAPTLLTLVASASGTAGGAIDETGTLFIGTLAGSATGSASLLSTTNANAVQDVGSFTSQGFALNDGVALAVSGPLNGNTSTSITDLGSPLATPLTLTVLGSIEGSVTTLDAGAITVGGPVTATSLTLTSLGSIASTTGGDITATSLTGSAGGAVSLTGTNAIGTLASFTAAGLTLADGITLEVDGPVQGGTSVSLSDLHDLMVPGTIGAATLSLSVGGAVSETGTIDAGLLHGSVTGSATFTGSNSIGTLGTFAAASLTLDDTTALSVAGSVTAGATILDALAIDIPGTLTASSLLLTSAGSISETGTLLVSGALSGSAAGSVSLSGSNSNSIVTISDFTASGGVSLSDNADLTITGLLDGQAGVSLTDTGLITVQGTVNGAVTGIMTANLDVPGTITAGTNLTLTVGGSVTEGGSIVTPSLVGTVTGDALFTGLNSVNTLGPFNAGSLVLQDTPALTIVGDVTSGSSIAITDIGALAVQASVTGVTTALTGATIAVPGSVSSTSLALTSTSGDIDETGSLAVGTLTGTSAGAASLTGGNSVATLSDFTAANGFILNDTLDLDVTGAVIGGPTVTIADTGVLTVTGSITGSTTSLTGASLNILDPVSSPGLIDAATSLTLTATSATIIETGSLTTALLSGSAVGSASLIGTNAIAAIDDFTAAGFTLVNSADLTINRAVSGGAYATITDTGSLAINGSLSGSTISLAASQISSPGALTTALLQGQATGAAAFTGTNQIGTLGSFAASSFVLEDSTPLSVTGPVTAGLTSLTAAGIDIPGSVTGTNSLTLSASGPITETGQLITALLAASASGNVSLTGSNFIAQLGDVTADGLALTNMPNLTVVGAVNGAGSVVVDEAGALTVAQSGTLTGSTTDLKASAMTITGQIAADTQLTLNATTDIGETGSINAAMLTGSAGTNAVLSGVNQIAGIDGFTVGSSGGGSFTLQDVSAVTLTGTLNALLNAENTVGGFISLQATGDITEAADAKLVTGVLGTSATFGTISLLSPADISLASGSLIDAPTIIVGQLTAGNAPSVTPTLVTWASNTIITGASVAPGASKPQFPYVPGGKSPGPGIYVVTNSFVQTGTTQVTPSGTVEIALAKHNGSVTFDQSSSAGLYAPRSELFLNLNDGTASGHITVAGLIIGYIEPGSNTPTSLYGTIDGENGPAAAGASFIVPEPSSTYRFNTCPIQSINCILVSPIIVPVTNPVEDVEVTSPRRRREDDDLIIPNVGEEDF